MNDRNEILLVLPEETLMALGIDEDTAFEIFFKDGAIKIHILDEEEFNEDKDFWVDDVPECIECPHFCWRCSVCTLD